MKTLCIIVLSLFCRSVSIVRPGSSQTICPSRDLNLIESGRNCRKPCSSDSDCRGRFKRCRCDDVCGMSCFNPNAECARLPVISFGRVIYRSRKYGSQVNYRCNPGWVLTGNAVRTCRSDKKWSGTAAQCLILRCNEPEAPDHGSVVTEEISTYFTYGSEVEFTCDPGYENIGSASAICNKRATWEGMANCTGIKLKCGQTVNHTSTSPSRFVGRVVGGINADRSWPWQALIMVKHGTVYNTFASSFAGGTLINQHWVLTAAHIFDRYSLIENWTKRFVVAVGIFRRPDRRSNIDSNVIVFQPRNIVVHERFDRSDRHERNNYDYDVALIRVGIELSTIKENGLWIWTDSAPKFNGTIPLSAHVNPICLPCSNSCIPIENYMFRNESRLINENDSEGAKCLKKGKWLANHFTEDRAPVFVTGFGFTNLTRRTMPFKLQQATQRIQPDSICKIAANKIVHETLLDVRYTDRMICARSETSAVSDVCKGDSGGPLMRKYKIPNTSESCWIQVGIVSFGYKCGQVDRNTGFRFPGFYTDVSKVQSWIDSTIVLPDTCSTSSVNGYQRLRNNKKGVCDDGWTVFQRRFDGSVDFNRNWQEYKDGFGNMEGEFWLGLDEIHELTSGQNCKLKIKMTGFDAATAYAQYSSFAIDDESENYRLHVSGFSGTAGDSLEYHNGMQFTTKDRDNDRNSGRNCALLFGADGGWWYRNCGYCKLNAEWGRSGGYWRNMIWYHWKGKNEAIKESTMMFKCE